MSRSSSSAILKALCAGSILIAERQSSSASCLLPCLAWRELGHPSSINDLNDLSPRLYSARLSAWNHVCRQSEANSLPVWVQHGANILIFSNCSMKYSRVWLILKDLFYEFLVDSKELSASHRILFFDENVELPTNCISDR